MNEWTVTRQGTMPAPRHDLESRQAHRPDPPRNEVDGSVSGSVVLQRGTVAEQTIRTEPSDNLPEVALNDRLQIIHHVPRVEIGDDSTSTAFLNRIKGAILSGRSGEEDFVRVHGFLWVWSRERRFFYGSPLFYIRKIRFYVK